MAKDAKGHGSDSRGGGGKPEFNAPPGKSDLALMGRYLRGGLSASESAQLGNTDAADAHAAATLAAGHPKSGVPPVHPDAHGRSENAAWQNFHKTRLTRGPHYLDPNDPRGRKGR